MAALATIKLVLPVTWETDHHKGNVELGISNIHATPVTIVMPNAGLIEMSMGMVMIAGGVCLLSMHKLSIKMAPYREPGNGMH